MTKYPIESVKRNTERVREMDARIGSILNETASLRTGLNGAYSQCLAVYGKDYAQLTNEQKQGLGSLINLTRALSALLVKTVGEQAEDYAG